MGPMRILSPMTTSGTTRCKGPRRHPPEVAHRAWRQGRPLHLRLRRRLEAPHLHRIGPRWRGRCRLPAFVDGERRCRRRTSAALPASWTLRSGARSAPRGLGAAQKALYANRRRVRGRRGRRLQRCRGEVVERTFAHMYETDGMRRVWVRGHENVRKRVLLQAAACNIGLLLRSQTGIGTPRSLQGRAVSAICRLIGRLIDRWGRLTRAWGSKWTPATLAGSIAHRQAA